jgi:hypothetical protein
MAFKMKYKGFPMHNPEHGGQTGELLNTLDAYGKGGKNDPVEVKRGKRDLWKNKGVEVPGNYDEMSAAQRNKVKNSPGNKEEVARNKRMADSYDTPVTGAEVASQAKTAARRKARKAKK